MDLYAVEWFGAHEGCVDNWSNMEDSVLEIIFDSLEKAKNYVEEKSKEIMTDKENLDLYVYDDVYYYITKMKCNEPISKKGTDIWEYNVRKQKWTNCEEE